VYQLTSLSTDSRGAQTFIITCKTRGYQTLNSFHIT